MKNLLALSLLAALAFTGCATDVEEPVEVEATEDAMPTGDHDLGAPEDLDMKSTGASKDLDPYKDEMEASGDHGATDEMFEGEEMTEEEMQSW